MILGYQASNRSVGDEWMLLEIGITVLDKTPDYTLTRGALSLETPDGKTLPLPSVTEQREGNVQAIQQRAKVQRDSINYFPVKASRPCALLFFPDLGSRTLPYDEVDLTDDRACIGRLYFRIPGGIAYGQHWLNVKFANSLVRVPFRILTKEEEQTLSKNYKSHRQAGRRGIQAEEEVKPAAGAVEACHADTTRWTVWPDSSEPYSRSNPIRRSALRTSPWTSATRNATPRARKVRCRSASSSAPARSIFGTTPR